MEEKQEQALRTNCQEEYCIIRFTDPMLYDRLHILSLEYSIPIETLINQAIKKMLSDVEFFRELRLGK